MQAKIICKFTQKVGDLNMCFLSFLIYGNGLLNALKNVAVVNVNKVMLELGIKVDGKMGGLFMMKTTAESNLNVTVKCSFPFPKEANESKSV
jgi:hypothetical protein